MPKFKDEDAEQHKIVGSNYGYSAARPNTLTATEYTLATVVFDESGSTSGFSKKMEECLKEIVKACRRSPRADNLMFRVLNFGSRLREVHGFKLLSDCNETDYDGCYQPGGGTALFDSSHNGIEATRNYAKQLSDNDFQVNGIVFVLTDGDDNESRFGKKEVGEALAQCVKSESMESLLSILIGVNAAGCKQFLEDFARDAGFTQFVDMGTADEKAIAKLAQFVSKSISSQSQALGTGGPSQSLTF